MMLASEILYVIGTLRTKDMDGDVYYKDEKGILHVIDYIYEDADSNLIMCSRENKRKEISDDPLQLPA